ncbi:MAG: putative DNA binding domain-containing protein [Bacteroidetes bacterium]|uniref:ATP-binding protein n=1 Tax=Phnomibacter sp. TaxID=2836217 RepID=UPI002FDCE06C|nr:putative DNA binding domain-containing protein [Bacteroidota bacterium]
MTEAELHQYLKSHFPKENEHCEWKAFRNLRSDVSGRAGDDVISYVSAIANMEGGHLVMGVEDKTLSILGIQQLHDYTPENFPYRILGNCTHLPSEGLKVESFTTSDSHKTIWVLHIPKHAARQPVIAHKKAWQRSGDSLIELTASRKENILIEPLHTIDDWSAAVCPDATVQELDETAIAIARLNFKVKNPRLAVEIEQWDSVTFLTKTKLLVNGHVTRTAILLLGKPEAVVHLNPLQPQISWVLYTKDKVERDYQHFEPPYILAVDDVYAKIRNLKYRYLKDGTLFPEEIEQYDAKNIKEALSNCIAHMDFTLGGRITVAENEDGYISFTNPGTFLPGSVEDVLKSEDPPSFYRNTLLAKTMESFNMIDSIGSGIKRMFRVQRDRFFPMPDYDFTGNKVKVTLIGKVLDMEYARVLARNPELSLDEIILLDKVQKKKELNDAEVRVLKAKHFIEGRKPNFHISVSVAEKTEQKADYIKTRGFKDDHYKAMILEFIEKYGTASKEDINKLVLDLLPKVLNEEQRANKVRNLVYAMSKRDKTIKNSGTSRYPKWIKN